MNGSASKHYQQTKQIVQSIKTLAKQNHKYNEHWEAINQFIDEYSLAAYISGLQKPYFGYAQAAGPKTLEDAYAFVCKFTSNETTRKMNQNENKPEAQRPTFNKHINNKQSDGKFDPQRPPSSYQFNKDKTGKRDVKAPEPMEIGSVRSRLTVNKNFNNQETIPDEVVDDMESNFSTFSTMNAER